MLQMKIIAKTEIGRQAMLNEGEQKKGQLKKKAQWAINQTLKVAGYKQEKISEEPLTILITLPDRFKMMYPQILEGLENQFTELGAVKEVDYYTEIGK